MSGENLWAGLRSSTARIGRNTVGIVVLGAAVVAASSIAAAPRTGTWSAGPEPTASADGPTETRPSVATVSPVVSVPSDADVPDAPFAEPSTTFVVEPPAPPVSVVATAAPIVTAAQAPALAIPERGVERQAVAVVQTYLRALGVGDALGAFDQLHPDLAGGYGNFETFAEIWATVDRIDAPEPVSGHSSGSARTNGMRGRGDLRRRRRILSRDRCGVRPARRRRHTAHLGRTRRVHHGVLVSGHDGPRVVGELIRNCQFCLVSPARKCQDRGLKRDRCTLRIVP
ncbi:MAG: hypothetical protein R2705_22335 [Ilumatobacteraceae bacterium]